MKSYVAAAFVGAAVGLLLRAPGVSAGERKEILWVHDLTRPAIMVPAEFALDAVRVFYGCEVRTSLQAPYGDPGAAQNPASGAMGTPQLMRLHTARMASLGLDYNDDRDRLRYSFEVLLPEQGWKPWRGCW